VQWWGSGSRPQICPVQSMLHRHAHMGSPNVRCLHERARVEQQPASLPCLVMPKFPSCMYSLADALLKTEMPGSSISRFASQGNTC